MLQNGESTDVRQHIIDCARVLFIEKGYEGTSVRDIASASGTNVAMVNYYFRSKMGLFEIIFAEAFEVLVSRIFAVLDSGRPTMDMIVDWIEAYYDLLARYPQIPNFIFTAVSHNPEMVGRIAEEYNPQAVFSRLSGRLETAMEKGSVREYPPLDLAMNIVSLCVFPFVIGPLATKVAGVDAQEYGTFLAGHKQFVIAFVKNALKAK